MSTPFHPRPLGRYVLVRRLAIGGMAEVYLAKVRSAAGFEKDVAIKRIHPSLRADETAFSSLAEEAKLSVALSHPNIVQIFDLDSAEGSEFIVMEHVEGYDAQHVLDALGHVNRRVPIDLAAHIVAEVCRGLHYAHLAQPGLVHRDVSPQNVLLSFAGDVKLADFGIAKTRASGSDPDLGVIKGKYFYMSPEQARAEPLDHRSDIFSAGVVLWELLAGRRLHEAPDVASLLDAVRRAEVRPPSSSRPLVPAKLDAVVARATARRPANRYPDAGAMAADIDTYLATRPPVRASRQLGALLRGLPPPSHPTSWPSSVELPQTRDCVVTAEMAEPFTPADPPLRYGLDDGRATVAGRRAPASPARTYRWVWALIGGFSLVVFTAWWLHGS